MKVNFKSHAWFRRGMHDGVSDFAFNLNDPQFAIRTYNLYKKFEINAYLNGYKLANQQKYCDIWHNHKSLLFSAIKTKDIIAVGWEIYYSIDGNWVEET